MKSNSKGVVAFHKQIKTYSNKILKVDETHFTSEVIKITGLGTFLTFFSITGSPLLMKIVS